MVTNKTINVNEILNLDKNNKMLYLVVNIEDVIIFDT